MKRRLSERQQQRIAQRQAREVQQRTDLTPGLIIAHHGKQLLLETADGAHRRGHARRTLGTLTTGDRVGWTPDREGLAAIETLEPRKNVLVRPDTHGKARLMAANIDQVLIMVAPVPLMNPSVVERAMVATMDMPADPVLVLNKVDREAELDLRTRAELDRQLAEWTALGIPLYRVSVRTGQGLDGLRAALRDRVSLLVGLSGVGKTSLTRLLIPAAQDAEVRELSEHSQEGQHTTRASRLYHLPGGGALIDAPGVRDFGVTELSRMAVDRAFPDIIELAEGCRFHNCQHLAEPQCAVREALDQGRLDQRRYDHYQALCASASETS